MISTLRNYNRLCMSVLAGTSPELIGPSVLIVKLRYSEQLCEGMSFRADV